MLTFGDWTCAKAGCAKAGTEKYTYSITAGEMKERKVFVDCGHCKNCKSGVAEAECISCKSYRDISTTYFFGCIDVINYMETICRSDAYCWTVHYTRNLDSKRHAVEGACLDLKEAKEAVKSAMHRLSLS